MHTPDNFMRWFPEIFQFLGLWPPQNKQLLYYSAYAPIFAFFTLYLNISEIIECYNNRDDFKQTLLNLGIICLHLIATMRIIHWHFVRNDCKILLNRLLADNFTFKNLHLEHKFLEEKPRNGTENGYKAAVKFWQMKATKLTQKPENEKVEKLDDFRTKTVKFANRQSCILYFSVAFLMFGDIFVSYASVRVLNAWEAKHSANATKILPYNTYFFFDAQRYYDVAWLYQFFSILFTMTQMGPIDIFVLSVIINLMSYLKIVQKALITIDDHLEEIPVENRDFVKETKLVKCINEIQRLLWIARKLDSLFNVVLLFHYGGLTVVLCNIIYLIPLVDSYFEIFTFTTVALVVIADVFVICWFAHSMMDEFSNISASLYEIQWYECTPKTRKLITFAMMQAQKPVVLTFGKIFQINLQFFNNFLKMSYSFYTLLENTQEQK